MILQLRQRHHRMFLALGVLLPFAFAGGVAARKAVPFAAELPRTLFQPEAGETQLWERTDLFVESPVRVSLARNLDASLSVRIFASRDLLKPDLLVYWSATATNSMYHLPEDAVLLGTFDVGCLRLPASAAVSERRLILFSLADQKIVAVSGRVKFNDASK